METRPAAARYESSGKDGQQGNTSSEETNRGDVLESSSSTRAHGQFLGVPSLTVSILGAAIMSMVLLAMAWKDDSAVVRISVIVTMILCLILVGGAVLICRMLQRIMNASNGL